MAELFGVFLVPDLQSRSELQRIIEQAAQQVGASAFEPHILLYSGEFSVVDNLKDLLPRAIHGAKPLTLEVKGIKTGEGSRDAVFVELADDPALKSISDKIGNSLEKPQLFQIKPHMPLVLKDIAPEVRQQIATAASLSKSRITFSEVAVMAPGKSGAKWDSADWTLKFRKKFG